MIEWLKSKWQWLIVAGVVLAAYLAGRGLSKDQIRQALALRKLTDATDAHLKAQARSTQLEVERNRLEQALKDEQDRAEKEKADVARRDDGAVVLDLKRRKLLK